MVRDGISRRDPDDADPSPRFVAGAGAARAPGERLRDWLLPPGTRRWSAARATMRALRRRRPASRQELARVERFITESPEASESSEPGAAQEARPSALLVRGCGGASGRYRVEAPALALERAGARVLVLDALDPGLRRLAASLGRALDLLILQRVRLEPEIIALLEAAAAVGARRLFETDDLSVIPSAGAPLEAREISAQAATLQRCDGVIVSTPALARALEEVLPAGLERRVWPNWLTPARVRVGDQRLAARRRALAEAGESGPAVIGYGSGTPSHDADLELVAGALGVVLDERPELRLELVGPVALPAALRRHAGRITRCPLLTDDAWLERLSSWSLNLAPLVASPFAAAKSDVKWLEAALVGVPTLACPVGAYVRADDDARPGLMVAPAADWPARIGPALDDLAALHEVGLRAAEFVRAERSIELGCGLSQGLLAEIRRGRAAG